MAATAIVLDFEKHRLHALQREGLLWFVLADVCEILGIGKADRAASRLDAKHKGTHTVSTLGGPQRVTIISESGLYKLAYTSRKPVAERFVDWLVNDVLPEIRRTGSYHGGSAPLDALIGSLQPELNLSPANDDNVVEPLTTPRESDAEREWDVGDYMDADAPLPKPLRREIWQEEYEGRWYAVILKAHGNAPFTLRMMPADSNAPHDMWTGLVSDDKDGSRRVQLEISARVPLQVVERVLTENALLTPYINRTLNQLLNC